ncbi:HNH endonuclease [Enterococcus faecalis]|uniref:Putative HNH nuclease YajD n=1 Tax=Enterococcus faecalis TX0630 TaxID=749508 RepID=A0ABC9P857_ENTFL|nr:HNH endonuclease signature motif containing protein [Enterococcus faecalis]EFU18075.1 HNH endonuclease domain protein [Enterococcus faecalis TX1346]EFU91130.1 HNH endonuclease domain protein [Enterococcus faecalis TX0630]EGO2633277.1 HNH endonuclease [Enterococcus faecalis]EGO8501923.1 HNH endonuclease [Enterococcus faecalis]EGQ7430384.1 HNH endonuclease [Enterococcus faecalis]
MRYCQFEGCSNTTERGAYCSEHARSSRKKKKQGNVYHHENKSFYRTPAWRDMREVIYERDRGCCKRCGKFVFGRKAHVHHIVPIKNNPLLKLDPNNLILLCSECHPIVEQETETKKVFPSYF